MIAKVTAVQPNIISNSAGVIPAVQAGSSQTEDKKPFATLQEKKSDAMDNFLTSPSFNTKQIALESFWKQITQNSASLLQKPGQT
ncbi:MAG: hypothetical protein VB032_09605 [Burkholderiaceae bacterium]|nr:hypothetical protein [Burkholderiaceae bacterium]